MPENEINMRASKLRAEAAAIAEAHQLSEAAEVAETREYEDNERAKLTLASQFVAWAHRHSIPFDRPADQDQRRLSERLLGKPPRSDHLLENGEWAVPCPAGWVLAVQYYGSDALHTHQTTLVVTATGELVAVGRRNFVEDFSLDSIKDGIAEQVIKNDCPWD